MVVLRWGLKIGIGELVNPKEEGYRVCEPAAARQGTGGVQRRVGAGAGGAARRRAPAAAGGGLRAPGSGVVRPADFGLRPYDPLAWAKRYEVAPAKAGEAFLELLLQGDCGKRARDLILGASRDGNAEGLRKALQLIVHCPQYQLA
jgi:hypothetical protein